MRFLLLLPDPSARIDSQVESTRQGGMRDHVDRLDWNAKKLRELKGDVDRPVGYVRPIDRDEHTVYSRTIWPCNHNRLVSCPEQVVCGPVMDPRGGSAMVSSAHNEDICALLPTKFRQHVLRSPEPGG